MDTKSKAPENISWKHISEWEQETVFHEGVMLSSTLQLTAEPYCNWLLFYAWCYVRSEGFTSRAWKQDWDIADLGKNYPTSREGIMGAVNAFLTFKSVLDMPSEEGTETLLLYRDIIEFCDGVVFEPTPIPPPKPEEPKPEEPKPKPEPEKPKPEPEQPQEPPKGSMKIPWKLITPILVVVLSGASMFVPGWAKTVIDIVIKILNGLGG